MFGSFTLTSPEPVVAVRERLTAALTTARPPMTLEAMFGFGPTTFRGLVTGTGFRLVRNLTKTARTLPIVASGRFEPTNGGTTIRVRTRPQWWVVLAVAAWSAFWADFVWRRLVSESPPGGVHRGEVGLLLGFLAFGWGLMFVAWALEAGWYREGLARVLERPAGE